MFGNLFAFLRHWADLDGLPDWAPDDVDGVDPGDCKADREEADAREAKPDERVVVFPVVDVEIEAARATYRNGKNKRKRHRLVDLRKRRVGIVIHQAGVERGERRWRQTAHRVTCNRAIGPAGTRYRVHPLNVRLVASNRLDRKPWHSIDIEVLGNFEGVDGAGNWWRPESMGYGRMGEAQLSALRQEIAAIKIEVEAVGATLDWMAPHRVSGQRKGRPNRNLCCGSRQWAEAGEWAVTEYDLAMPGPEQTFGGMIIDPDWHGRFYDPDHRRMT